MALFLILVLTVFILIIFLALFLLNFYRDPERKIPIGNNVVSPADGKIIDILNTKLINKNIVRKKGFLGKIEIMAKDIAKECCVIAIFMSPFDVHVNRSPIDGKVLSVTHKPGKYFVAFSKKSFMNEKNEIVIKNKEIGKIKVIQVAGFFARRILCDIRKNGSVMKGQRIGKIVLGSQVILILPSKKLMVKIKKGQKVFAGKTIIATFLF